METKEATMTSQATIARALVELAHRKNDGTTILGWLLATVAVVLAAQLALAGGAMADEPDPKSEPAIVEEPLSFVVDSSLETKEGIATIADSHGDRSDFAADERS